MATGTPHVAAGQGAAGRAGAVAERLRLLGRPWRGVWARHGRALRVAGLTGILLFNFWAGMSPHLDYPYPLHVDEWWAIGFAQSTLAEGSLEYPSPYWWGDRRYHAEMGFHLVLGSLKSASGLGWMELYRYAPGVLYAMLAFLTYAFGRRGGFGWAAALFLPLIPTSIRTLGPAFVAPVTAAMLFIPITLLALLALEGRSQGKSLWLMLIVIGGTLFVHPTTEGVVTSLAAMYLASTLVESVARGRFRAAAGLVGALWLRLLAPVAVLGLWIPSTSREVLEQSLSGEAPQTARLLGYHTGFFEAFGVAAVALSIAGIMVFTPRGQYGRHGIILPIYTALLLAFLVILFPRYNLGPPPLYDRGWVYLGYLFAIFAGYAVASYFSYVPSLASGLASRLRRGAAGVLAPSLWMAGAVVVAIALATGLFVNEERREYSRYYHVVTETSSLDFVWIGERSSGRQMVALGEPTMGWALPPLAGPGVRVYLATAAPKSQPLADQLREMARMDRVDARWLRERSITLFYSCIPGSPECIELSAPGLYKVRRGVYYVPYPPAGG